MCGRDITIRNKDEIEHLGKLLFLRDFDKDESEIVKKEIKRMNYFTNPNISVDELLNFAKEDEEYRLILDSYFNCVYNVFKFLLEMKFIELLKLRNEVFKKQQNLLKNIEKLLKTVDENELDQFIYGIIDDILNETPVDIETVDEYIRRYLRLRNNEELSIKGEDEVSIYEFFASNEILFNKILKSYESFEKYREDLVNILEQMKSSKNFDEKIELFKNLNKILTNESVKSFLNLFSIRDIISYFNEKIINPDSYLDLLQTRKEMLLHDGVRLNEYMKKYSNNKNSNSNS